MTFNWGHGIALFYSFFVCTLIIVVIKSTSFDNSLVTDNYYERDINYQAEYNRLENAGRLTELPRINIEGTQGYLEFPTEVDGVKTGQLHVYRPSSNRHDRVFPIAPGTKEGMSFSLDELPAGRYVAILEWTAGTTAYRHELPFTL